MPQLDPDEHTIGPLPFEDALDEDDDPYKI